MISALVQLQDMFFKVLEATKRATFRNLGHGAASIRKDMQRSLVTSPEPSRPGTPPHTRRGQLRRAIVYDVQGDSAVIGPRASFVGESGRAHEFGEQNYRGRSFDERPFAHPALERGTDRFHANWAGSVTEE